MYAVFHSCPLSKLPCPISIQFSTLMPCSGTLFHQLDLALCHLNFSFFNFNLILTWLLSFCFLSTFLLSVITSYPRFILCIPCPSPRISHLSKELWLFYRKLTLDVKMWVFVSMGVSMHLSLLSGQKQELMHVYYPCIHAYL